MKGNMETTIEEQPRYLDGPKLVEWLTEEGVDHRSLTDAQKRRWREWKSGDRADLYGLVDRVLTNNGLSIRLIPDDCWSENQEFLLNASYKEAKQDAQILLQEGRLNNKEIAKKVGVTPDTIKKWSKQFCGVV